MLLGDLPLYETNYGFRDHSSWPIIVIHSYQGSVYINSLSYSQESDSLCCIQMALIDTHHFYAALVCLKHGWISCSIWQTVSKISFLPSHKLTNDIVIQSLGITCHRELSFLRGAQK